MVFEFFLRSIFFMILSISFLLVWCYLELSSRGKHYGFNEAWKMIYDFKDYMEKDKLLKRKCYIIIGCIAIINLLVFLISL